MKQNWVDNVDKMTDERLLKEVLHYKPKDSETKENHKRYGLNTSSLSRLVAYNMQQRRKGKMRNTQYEHNEYIRQTLLTVYVELAKNQSSQSHLVKESGGSVVG
jgi:hypothetical protein